MTPDEAVSQMFGLPCPLPSPTSAEADTVRVVELLKNQKAELEELVAEYDQLFQLQWTRSVQADALWQKAHGKPNTIPDLGELLGWLMESHAPLLKVEHEAMARTIRILMYWILRAYDAILREGWEPGPSVNETQEQLHDLLSRFNLNPNKKTAEKWRKQKPVFGNEDMDLAMRVAKRTV